MSDSADERFEKSQRYLIDSYGWIEYFSDGRFADKYAKLIESADPSNYITPALVIYEVYKKIRLSFGEEEAIKAAIHIKAKTKVIDVDTEIAIESADVSITENLPMADAIIYGTAKVLKAKLITSDRHFREKDNVVLIE